MTKKILIIDDERHYHKMISHAIQDEDYLLKTAECGEEGLAIAEEFLPDLIITDILMPGISGYEVVRQIRQSKQLQLVPVLVLTAQTELQEKLDAFDAGADDHLSKPFAPPELKARVISLLRQGEKVQASQKVTTSNQGKIIAVQSLRGGAGSSMLAANLAVALRQLWEAPTLLLDMCLSSGEAALLLNGNLKKTWASVCTKPHEEIDFNLMKSAFSQYANGLDYMAAPAYPYEADLVTVNHFAAAYRPLRYNYEHIVIDLPHYYDENTVRVLNSADVILLLATPELAGIRDTSAALHSYRTVLNYPEEKINIVLNTPFEHNVTYPLAKIESYWHKQVSFHLPYAGDLVMNSINNGIPFVVSSPKSKLAMTIEDMAFALSKDYFRKDLPEKRNSCLHRVLTRQATKVMV